MSKKILQKWVNNESIGNILALYKFENNLRNEVNTSDVIIAGKPQITNRCKPFGNTSLYLNGSSYIDFVNAELFDFGTNEFTISFFIYIPSSPARWTDIIGALDHLTPKKSWMIGFAETDLKPAFVYSVDGASTAGTEIFSSAALPVGAWSYFAIVRDNVNNLLRLFLDGTQTASAPIASETSIYSNGGTWLYRLGARTVNVADYYFTGYIKRLEILKVAKSRTTTITVPIS